MRWWTRGAACRLKRTSGQSADRCWGEAHIIDDLCQTVTYLAVVAVLVSVVRNRPPEKREGHPD